MPTITFQYDAGNSIKAFVQEGINLLEAAKQAGIAIDAPCGGNGTCGKCRVKLLDGALKTERNYHLSDRDFEMGWRLSCCSEVISDVTVLVPETASAFKTGIRTADLNDKTVREVFDRVQKSLKASGVMRKPALFTAVITMSEPTLEDTMPDNERLVWAVREQLGAGSVRMSLTVLRKLALLLRENHFTVKCIMKRENREIYILDIVRPDEDYLVCGLAVDIGTTTVSAALADMETGTLLARASAGNGQIRYGADVINRIIASVKPGGSEKLRKAVVNETLLPLIEALCREAGISKQQIYRVCCAGNTTMSHLLLGLYSDPVRMEPFIPSFFHCDTLRANEVIPGLIDSAELVMTPTVGSYVGGDITTGVLASGLWKSPEVSLLIDLGTNGELVLGNNEYMMCCACSAGPAFEGGDISCGMRATTGAIEAVKIDADTMEPMLQIVGNEGQKPLGLCGSGIIDIVAELFRTGIISPKGKFVREGKRIRYDLDRMGSYVFAFADESADGRELSINEVDIDNFIRAKGAIFSAAHLLMKQLGITPEDVSSFWIAGGIGGGINFRNAVVIGMFPDLPLERFHYMGNTSLSGAYSVLLSTTAEHKTEALAKNMMYVELSNEPSYMDEFVSACFLPHTDGHLFPSVKQER